MAVVSEVICIFASFIKGHLGYLPRIHRIDFLFY